MGCHPKQNNSPPAGDQTGSAERSPAAGDDRRAVRTADLTDEDIAAIEASEMEPGFEHLNAEIDDV